MTKLVVLFVFSAIALLQFSVVECAPQLIPYPRIGK
nr:venom peptide [Acharia stimulea]